MLLHSLRLKNFKRYRDEQIRFRDGITGIIGNNGSGKSTIVEAVLFALYGVRGLGQGAGEFVVHSLAGPRDVCEVRLDFGVGGTDYTVVRSFRKGTSGIHDAELHIGDSLLAKGVSDVSQQITRIIGMGPEDFRHTIYAGQRDLHSLLEKQPGDRRKWFMRVLGIDFIKEEADTLLRERIQEKEKDLIGYQTLLEQFDADETVERQQKAADDFSACSDAITRLEGEYRNRSRELEQVEASLQAAQKKKEAYIRLKAQEESRVHAIGLLEQEMRRLAGEYAVLEDETGALRDLEGAEEAFRRSRERAEGERERKETDERLAGEERAIADRIADLRERLGQHEADLSALAAAEEGLFRLEPEIARRNSLLHELEGLRQNEPRYRTCREALHGVTVRLNALEERVRSFRDEMTRLERICAAAGDPAGLETTLASCEAHRDAIRDRASAAREQEQGTVRERARFEGQYRELREQGQDGVCPTCHRALGDEYPGILQEFEALIAACDTRRSDLLRLISSFDAEQTDCDAQIAGLRDRLRQARDHAARLETLRTDWQHLCAEAEACFTQREETERDLSGIAFDPDRKISIEAALAGLDPAWREHLALNERLSRKDETERRTASLRADLRNAVAALDEVTRRRSGNGFDPARYAHAQEAFESADAAFRRYLALREKAAQMPGIARTIEDRNRQLETARRELEEIREEGARYGDANAGYLEAAQQRSALLRACEMLASSRAEKTAERGALERELRRLTRERETIAGYAAISRKLEQESALLKMTRQKLGDYVTYLLYVVRDRIEAEAGRVLSEITDGRYENVLIDDSFNVLVHDMGDQFPANRFSGGEQDDIAIALRIALSHYLADMHQLHDSTFLIFDEIFGSQDEERRNHLLMALRSQESRFQQIFLISHISDIQGEFTNTLQVEMGPDDTSRILEVS
ncbi:MAG: SMC family ATPase [Methanomicrobiales archaeon]|nr:SMC family ATPase [Methanomicrobiales archaeon]